MIWLSLTDSFQPDWEFLSFKQRVLVAEVLYWVVSYCSSANVSTPVGVVSYILCSWRRPPHDDRTLEVQMIEYKTVISI